MRLRPTRWTAVAALCAAALVTALVAVVLVRDRQQPPVAAAASRAVTIPAAGGARLSAQVYAPTGAGRFPLVVMPASWGSADGEYAAVATGFALLGYVVVAYAQRGFGGSTGAIDFAGPATREDVSTVITWARLHTRERRGPVAVVGVSYGAGVALLAAEHDPRIAAVAALSGWTDFAATLAPGGTPSEVADALLFTGTIAHRPLGPDLDRLVSEFASQQPAAALAAVRAMSPVRSPIEHVAALNRRRTAVFLSGTLQDSLAPPADLVRFFQALTGPKRLELGVGDHGANALAGLAGAKTKLWADVAGWVGRYVGGAQPDTPSPPAVQLQDGRSGRWHSYPSWPALGRVTRFALTAPAGTPATGGFGSSGDSAPSGAPPWAASLAADVPTPADAGPQQLTTGAPYRAPTVTLGGIPRTAAAVWSGTALPAATLVTGSPHVQVTVRTAAPAGSLFAYLYDVDAAGRGELMSYGAVTVTGAQAATRPVDIALGPISWTVPAGDHVALVIDSADTRYLGRSVAGSTITLFSPATDPATLSLVMR